MNTSKTALLAFLGTLLILADPAAAAISRSQASYLIQCTILDDQGKIVRVLPGGLCRPFEDGTLLSGQETELAMYDKNLHTLWTKKLPTHHQINLSVDGREALVLSSRSLWFRNEQTRFDRLVVFDLAGKELRSYDFFDHLEELERIRAPDYTPFWDTPRLARAPRSYATREFSHANSFYEIPDNAAAARNPAFAKGNYIVNVNLLGVVIVLDHDLRRILWSMRQKTDCFGLDQHDVRMLPSGKLLVYDNFSFLVTVPGGPWYSTIDEVDPITGERRAIFKGNPPESFRSQWAGGVQPLPDGGFVISDITSGGRVIETNAEGKIVRSFPVPWPDERTGKPAEIPRAEKLDLSSFLSRNSGL